MTDRPDPGEAEPRSTAEPVPVVVIGNGPVGQTTALLLAQWGVRCLLLDRRPARDAAGSRAICQQRDVLDIWETVGAGRRIAAEGVTWVRARTYYREHELFSTEFVDRGLSPFPPFVNISQARTEELLDEQIATNPLIEVQWDHDVTTISQDGDGVQLGVATPTGPHGIPASYAVLATGARSAPLRSQLGLGFAGRSFDDQFLICDVRCALPGWEQERRFYFDPEWNPGRQVLIHPCPDSVYRIDWQVPPEFDLAAEERSGGLDRRIRQIIGDRPYEVVWHSLYRFHTRLAERMQVGRVLLAGDCAHLMAPFGARGLNSGVGDAENAAWKLAWVLRGWAGPRVLESYHDERHAAAVENLDVTGNTMDFLVPQTDEGRQRRRSLLQAAVTQATAREEVDSGRLSEPFWYVDSGLSTPDPTRPRATRPRRGDSPQPGVGVLLPDCPVVAGPSGEIVTLRQWSRGRVTVLVCGSESTARGVADALAVLQCPVTTVTCEALRGEVDVAEVLGARDGEAWVVRPDAHVAAVVCADDPSAALDAVRRLLAID